MNDNTLGAKVKYFRERAKLSQFDLEVQLNAAAGFISRIETGKVNPQKETLSKIIEVLGLNSKQAAQLFDLRIDDFSSLIVLSRKLMQAKNIDKLMHTAVNDLVNELDFLGAVIFILQGRNVFSKLVTKKPVTRIVDKVFGGEFDKLSINLDTDTENLVVKTILDQQTYYSEDLFDFTKGVLSKKLSKLLQKATKHTSAICIPITSGDKPLGAIMFSKDHVDDFSSETKILRELCISISDSLDRLQEE